MITICIYFKNKKVETFNNIISICNQDNTILVKYIDNMSETKTSKIIDKRYISKMEVKFDENDKGGRKW